jgi:transposase
MSKGKSDKITYKPYEQYQQYLIPPSADELIPSWHLVRLVSETIDEMGLQPVLEKKIREMPAKTKRKDKKQSMGGGGASRYHPVMMTKLFVYGYMTKVCSSRMLAKAARENVMFMWLSGSQKPDFRTLNDFRGKLLKGVMEEIFVTAVKMLAAKGYIKLENYFEDGTKIESASGRYTFVWKKSVEKNDRKLDEKLRAYIRMAEDIWDDENGEYGNRDLEELGGKEQFSSADVKELACILKERLKALEDVEDKKKLKKSLVAIKKDCLPRKKKYEKAKRICGERNSYSKTDTGATFMRMKEDHGKGRPKPGYNVQIGTESGFVVGYDIFPNPNDTKTLKPHLKRQLKRLGVKPKAVIADAGYGSEENYAYLENRGTVAVIKYNTYHAEKSWKRKPDIFKAENWNYDESGKYYTCPKGRKLTLRRTGKRTTESGYPTIIGEYECESCAYCRLKKQCVKSGKNRCVSRNDRLVRLRRKARRVLEDERYAELRKQRSVEVETVFGQINRTKVRSNQGYRRFLLRGTEKVSAEWGLLVLGYNFKQIYRLNRDNNAGKSLLFIFFIISCNIKTKKG